MRRTKYDSVVNVTAVSPGDRMVGEAGAGAGATPPATVGEALTPDSRAESCGRMLFTLQLVKSTISSKVNFNFGKPKVLFEQIQEYE